MKTHQISPEKLTFKSIFKILTENYKLELSEESKRRILKCREYLDEKMESQDEPIYGINTGFGSLCDIKERRHRQFFSQLLYSTFKQSVIDNYGADDELKTFTLNILSAVFRKHHRDNL